MRKKAVFNWSGGKDSALALKLIIESNNYEIISLLTTVNLETEESTLHKIPVSLLKKQAESLGFKLQILKLEPKCNMNGYDTAMRNIVDHFKQQGVTAFIFGDIFLEEIKSYREEKLNPMGIEVIEPLWGMTSLEVINKFIDSGLKTVIATATKPELKAFVSKVIDSDFITKFPKDMDICGENGEYHTFCYDGPIFNTKIEFSIGEVHENIINVKYEDGRCEDIKYWYAPLTE